MKDMKGGEERNWGVEGDEVDKVVGKGIHRESAR